MVVCLSRSLGPPRPPSRPELANRSSADATGLEDIVSTIRSDRPDSTDSNDLVRRLTGIGHEDETALVVLLHALAEELRFRPGRALPSEYRASTEPTR